METRVVLKDVTTSMLVITNDNPSPCSVCPHTLSQTEYSECPSCSDVKYLWFLGEGGAVVRLEASHEQIFTQPASLAFTQRALRGHFETCKHHIYTREREAAAVHRDNKQKQCQC